MPIDKAKKRERQKRWRLRHLEHARELKRKSYQRHKEERLKSQKKWKLAHPDCERVYNLKIKIEVLTHYSKGNKYPKCVICGFENTKALTIDHINGDRKENERLGRNLYYWLRRNNFPEGFQCLCMNCQMIKRSENKAELSKHR